MAGEFVEPLANAATGMASESVQQNWLESMQGTLNGTSGLENLSPPLQIALLLGSLVFLTAILVSVTSFTRIIIVLSFVRRALTTQEIPPNPSLIGLALFLTLFTMGPTFDGIYANAVKPYLAKEIQGSVAIQNATGELQQFMLYHTRTRDLAMLINLSGGEKPPTREEVSLRVLIPAFMISEMKTAFIMGFCIYVPFILIDLLVSTILMSLGMMMMPRSLSRRRSSYCSSFLLMVGTSSLRL